MKKLLLLIAMFFMSPAFAGIGGGVVDQAARNSAATAQSTASAASGVAATATSGGGWDSVARAQSPIAGEFKNLQASATGLSATVTVTADELVLENGADVYQKISAVSLSINSAGAGANGLDTGVLAASTWYSVWAIFNGATSAGLLSLSATAPTMPTGYTHKARIGWVRTDGTANKFPLSFRQCGRSVRYVVASGSNVQSLPLMASGALGTWSVTAPTWVAVPVGGVVPVTASVIHINSTNVYNSAVVALIMVAPSSAYQGYQSANPPAVFLGGANGGNLTQAIMLESSNIYAVSSGTAVGVQAYGWEDNL